MVDENVAPNPDANADALVSGGPYDPRQSNAIVRYFRGFGYLFRGWGFVFGKHPSLIKYCLFPLLINLLVFVGAAVALYFFYGDLVALIWAKPESWFSRIFWYIFYIFIFIAVMLLSYIAFFVVQAILSAPFNDILSERVEQLHAGQEPPPFSWSVMFAGLGRTILHELAKISIYLAVMIPLLALNIVVPVIGPMLFLFGGFYMTALFFGYDFMDFSMARRRWPFNKKWRLLKQNRALGLGLGSALAFALMIPVLGLLCLPMAAVGGTLLFCDLDKAGAFIEIDQRMVPPGPQEQAAPAAPGEPPGPPPASPPGPTPPG